MRRRSEPAIPAKLTIRVGDRKVVLRKHAGESERHVLLKAIVFALYADQYPNLTIEYSAGLKYKPDLVAFDEAGRISFWAECGETSPTKIRWLIRTMREGHLVFARQAGARDTFPEIVARAVSEFPRHGLIQVLQFGDEAWTVVQRDGTIDPRDVRPTEVRFDPTTG